MLRGTQVTTKQCKQNTILRKSISGPAETNLDEDGFDENYLENTGFAETFKINYLNWTDFPEFDPISKEKITRSTALKSGLLAVVFFFLR